MGGIGLKCLARPARPWTPLNTQGQSNKFQYFRGNMLHKRALNDPVINNHIWYHQSPHTIYISSWSHAFIPALSSPLPRDFFFRRVLLGLLSSFSDIRRKALDFEFSVLNLKGMGILFYKLCASSLDWSWSAFLFYCFDRDRKNLWI